MSLYCKIIITYFYLVIFLLHFENKIIFFQEAGCLNLAIIGSLFKCLGRTISFWAFFQGEVLAFLKILAHKTILWR